MASKKRQFEGIAMLSMYNDEEEEEEETEDVAEEEERPQEEDEKAERPEPAREQQDDDYLDSRMADQDDLMAIEDREGGADSAYDDTPPMESENTSPQPRVLLVSPQQEAADNTRMSRRGKLTIVDYGHDEVAMSPEPEDGEIAGSGRVMFGEELQTANGHFQDKTPPGTVQALTPSNKVTLPSSDPSRYDDTNHAVRESEGEHVEEAGRKQENKVNPLDKFLPPPPKEKCSEELQRKINKFLEYKKAGKSFNSEVRNRKDYRNPDFLLHAVRYQDIVQIGSCFSKDVFDPHGYDKSDYFDEIEADMRREEQERKKSQKVEFVSGTQPGAVASAPKINLPIPGSKKTLSVNSLVFQLRLLVACYLSHLRLIPPVGMVDRTRNRSGIRWMGIKEILCPLGGRILFLQLGLMRYFYLLLMLVLVLDTWLLRNKDGARQKRKDLVKGRWREDLEPFIVLPLTYHTTVCRVHNLTVFSPPVKGSIAAGMYFLYMAKMKIKLSHIALGPSIFFLGKSK